MTDERNFLLFANVKMCIEREDLNMKKLLISFMIAACLISGIPMIAADAGADRLNSAIVMYIGSPSSKVMNKAVQIDALNMKVRPVSRDSLVYVPARFVVESFGGRVDWDKENNEAIVTLGENTVKLKLYSDIMLVNGKAVKLAVPIEAEYGRILAPLNAFSEAIGRQVFYDRGLIVLSTTKDIFDKSKDRAFLNKLTTDISKPPSVGNQQGLKSLLKQIRESKGSGYYENTIMRMTSVSKKSESAPTAENQTAQAVMDNGYTGSPDYSATNVQVEGVDEADVVKTDGEYIYQVNGNKIIIVRAYPTKDMELASVIGFKDVGFLPLELYVDGKYLTVIGRSQASIPVYGKDVSKENSVVPPYDIDTVKAIIYDCSNKKDVHIVREVELDGSYISSRMIGTRLFLLANKSISSVLYSPVWDRIYQKGDYRELLADGYSKETVDNVLSMAEKPQFCDSAEGKGFIGIPYDRLRYFPDSIEPNYLVIASLDITKPGEKADISAYLGAGQNVYASLENMYISFMDYENYSIFRGFSGFMPESRTNTVVYKFSLENGMVSYRNKGTVPGSILNQFSMDEDKGFFRIATTAGDTWRSDEGTSRNNIYILDETMSITGKIENMAPGERIYSVRFVGDRAYVVTFRNVDPLFVLDLRNASSPRILGSLKLPGYSDYLQPYDENHIIGFGKETVETKGQAYYQGMKMAMFDVTDVAKPVRKFAVDIGDRGTDSELLRNHKALLFSKSKGLISFPVTLYEVTNRDKESQGSNMIQYGSFTFQGAYVYQVDSEKGFKLKGRITHLTEEDYQKAGVSWYDSRRNIDRILYINDTLYTLSQEEIRANNLADLKKTGSLMIK